MLPLNERAAQIMEHLVRHNSHGYSQYSRNGDGGRETITLSDGSKVTIATGDRDCSSAVIDAYRSAGLKLSGASYTGNMRKAFLKTGLFKWHRGTSYSAKRGDIYLNEGQHTAMCTQPYGSPKGDILAEFSISEKGTIDGKEGDQLNDKGWYAESHEKPYYNYPWDGILEFVGKSDKPSIIPKPKPKIKEMGKVDTYYQLKLEKGGWLPKVKNFNHSNDDGYAGLPCKRHTALSMTVTKGSIRYRVHSMGAKWGKWVYNGDVAKADAGRVIDAVQMYYITPDGYVYQQVYYRSQTTERTGYLATCCDDGTSVRGFDNYAGIYGEPLDRLQAYIGKSDKF